MIPYNKREGKIWYNNDLVDWQDVKLHVLSHGLHYASCVFEGERVYDGDIFKWIEYEVGKKPKKGSTNLEFKNRLAELLDGVNYQFIGYRQLSAKNLVNKKIAGVPHIEKTVSSGRMYSSNKPGRPGYPWGPAVAGEEPGFYWMNTGEYDFYKAR